MSAQDFDVLNGEVWVLAIEEPGWLLAPEVVQEPKQLEWMLPPRKERKKVIPTTRIDPVQKLRRFAWEKGWDDWQEVSIIGHGEPPKERITVNGWVVQSLADFKIHYSIPAEGIERVEEVEQRPDLGVIGFLVLDDERAFNRKERERLERERAVKLSYDPVIAAVVKDGEDFLWVRIYFWLD